MPKTKASTKAKIKVGTRVRFKFGIRFVTGEVVEDYGNIGVGGRRLLAVVLKGRDGERLRTDVPEEDVKVVGARNGARTKTAPKRVGKAARKLLEKLVKRVRALPKGAAKKKRAS